MPNVRSLGFAASLLGLLALCDCSQKPVSVPLRSLERSGKIALICLDPDGDSVPGYSLEDCQANVQAPSNAVSGNALPVRAYALVTQQTRGEVAMLDLTDNVVIDSDPSSPGFNFMPVGAEPTDIVVTPQSMAAFVSSGEVNRPGIYAIPSNRMRAGAPNILSWPACQLPARPGAMAMVVQPGAAPSGAAPNQLCPGPNYTVDTLHDQGAPQTHPQGDLGLETERPGARKLVVALPTEGDLLIIDAQTLLDRAPGSFDPCPVERRIRLEVKLPSSDDLNGGLPGPACPQPPQVSSSPVCPVRQPQVVTYPGAFKPFPSEFAMSGSTLYIADERAPVVHVVDLTDPCAPTERSPLLPSSFDNPGRPIFTHRLAVSPVTTDQKRFLYAVDNSDGSLMVFDISDQGAGPNPVLRPRADFFPFVSRDRLNLGAPVQAVTFVTDEVRYDNGAGSLLPGVLCDPSPAASAGGQAFRTAADFSVGAGPTVLRGTFALAALTNGQVVVIDVDDYDAACRRYKFPRTGETLLPSWVSGCDTQCNDPATCLVCTDPSQPLPASSAAPPTDPSGASGEDSCRIVDRHEIRSRYYFASTAEVGPHVPGVQTFPLLSLKGATLLTDATADGQANPKMLGPPPFNPATLVQLASPGAPPPSTPTQWTFNRSGTLTTVDANPDVADKNFVVPDLREPRTSVEQDWSLTFEGVIPGFEGRFGRLSVTGAPSGSKGVFDGSGGFCYRGVHDTEAAKREGLRVLGNTVQSARLDDPAIVAFAQAHRDLIEITNDLLDQQDPYWPSVANQCDFIRCRATFGTADTPTANRSFPIDVAYNDRVLIDPAWPPIKDITDPTRTISPECCFPTLVTYQVRGGQQWIANGTVNGFEHHVIIGPKGTCIDAGLDPDSGIPCDASPLLRTGRAYEFPFPAGGGAASPLRMVDRYAGSDMPTDPGANRASTSFVFHNAQMFFVVYQGAKPSVRDMSFGWHMNGGFSPLTINVGQGSFQVAPQAMLFHPLLGPEVLVSDASLQGVVTIDLTQLAINRTFFLAGRAGPAGDGGAR